MQNQKGFITKFGELIDEYRGERRMIRQDGTTLLHSPLLLRVLHWLIPNGGTLVIVALLLVTQSLWARPFAAPNAPGPSATTVNYQGRLADDAGVPLTGTYGMSFALYDAATDGALIWGPENHTAVPVSDGLFSVGLGSQTAGGIPTSAWNGDRYLEITVGGETLSPREPLRAVPYAMQASVALTVPDGSIGTAQIADGAVTQDKAPTLLVSGSALNVKVWHGTAEIIAQGGEDTLIKAVSIPESCSHLLKVFIQPYYVHYPWVMATIGAPLGGNHFTVFVTRLGGTWSTDQTQSFDWFALCD